MMSCPGSAALRPPSLPSRHFSLGSGHRVTPLLPARDVRHSMSVSTHAAGDSTAQTEATRVTSSSSDSASLRQARRRTVTQAAEPAPQSTGLPPVAVAVAAVAGIGVLAVLYNKFFASVGSGARSAVETLPQAVSQVRNDWGRIGAREYRKGLW